MPSHWSLYNCHNVPSWLPGIWNKQWTWHNAMVICSPRQMHAPCFSLLLQKSGHIQNCQRWSDDFLSRFICIDVENYLHRVRRFLWQVIEPNTLDQFKMFAIGHFQNGDSFFYKMLPPWWPVPFWVLCLCEPLLYPPHRTWGSIWWWKWSSLIGWAW